MNGTLRKPKTSTTTTAPKSTLKRSVISAPKRSISGSNVKSTVKNDNVALSASKPSLSKKSQENKENGLTLSARISSLEEKFDDLKKTIEGLVYLEGIVKELMPTFQAVKDDVQILKETISSRDPLHVSDTVQDSDVEALSSILSAEDKICSSEAESSPSEVNKELKVPSEPVVNRDVLFTPTKNVDIADNSVISRTPKIGDFDISATTLANLPKSNRHKSLSSISNLLLKYRMDDNTSQSFSTQHSLSPTPQSYTEDKSMIRSDNESFERTLGLQEKTRESQENIPIEMPVRNMENLNISKKRRKEPRKSEDCVSMFPQMKIVVEEELAPIRFLLGAIDINKLNNVIEKMNEYIADQGFDYGNYIKSIKLEDVSSRCKIPEKLAKLITHILCKLVRLEMKSENEFKILTGSTIQSM